jgi:hypothetical protein
MERDRHEGLTEKNRRLLRVGKTTNFWDDVLDLPAQLLREAGRQRADSPGTAAVNLGAKAGSQVTPARLERFAERAGHTWSSITLAHSV